MHWNLTLDSWQNNKLKSFDLFVLMYSAFEVRRKLLCNGPKNKKWRSTIIIIIITESDDSTTLQELQLPCTVLSSRFLLPAVHPNVSEGNCTSETCAYKDVPQELSKGTFHCAFCGKIRHPICTGTDLLTLSLFFFGIKFFSIDC